MSNEASEGVASVIAGNGDDDQGVADAFKALKLSNPPALGSKPCISPPSKTVELGEHARDSGYGSATSTPDPKDTSIPLRSPGQIPYIQRLGLCVSSKTMEPGTKRRFVEVHLEIEKLLLEFIQKLKSARRRCNPISIRPMMLGKTDADVDAEPYMVVICPEDIRRKVQVFFDERLVKSLCEPGDDDIPSFKTLVVGRPLRLRASTSDITVQCHSGDSYYDGTKTFCGVPIRLCDDLGHSRNATFGGMVKVTFTGGEYRLYGLTAGHMIRDHHVVPDEETFSLAGLNDNDLVDLNDTQEASPTMSNGIDLDNWSFSSESCLGKVLDVNAEKTLLIEGKPQMRPCLDWALFELNAYRPNQLVLPGPGHSRGDLHLPMSTDDPRKEEIRVAMLCASQGVKRGVLCTTRARVLLDGGDSFTDAYMLSLEGSEVSDGDSGSWVVDELHLEVYGHVVADDIFGDAYVIPMNNILADIQRYLGVESVDLPSGVDIIFMPTLQVPNLFAWPHSKDARLSQLSVANPNDISRLSKREKSSLPPIAEELQEVGSMISSVTESTSWSTTSPTDLPHRPGSVALPDSVILHPEHMKWPLYTDDVNPLVSGTGKMPHEVHGSRYGSLPSDSGYSSLHVTPNTSPPPMIDEPSPPNKSTTRAIQGRVQEAVEAADTGEFGPPIFSELMENFQSAFGLSLTTVRSLRRMLSERKESADRTKECADLCEFLSSRQILFNRLTSNVLVDGTSRGMSLEQFSAALSSLRYRLSREFATMFYGSNTRKHGTLMSLAEFVEACIKLERMTRMFKVHDTDRDGYIRIGFEDCLSMMVKLMD